jgi:threonine/homoserine/homoserine lactone efflux protein
MRYSTRYIPYIATFQAWRGEFGCLNTLMVIPSRLFEYAIAAYLIILAPGPSVLFIVARAIAWGKKIAVATATGNVSGSFVLATLTALGIGPILQRSELAYVAVQWGGGLYLIYLGIDAIRKRAFHVDEMTDTSSGAPTIFQTWREGFVVGVLNPKAIVFYAAVCPQFIDRERGHVTFQLWFLGLVFCIIALISDGAWGLLAGQAREWLSSDRGRLEKLRSGGGGVMIFLGVLIIIQAVTST